MSMLNESMQAIADATAAGLEQAAAAGDMIEWLGDAVTWTAPKADGSRIISAGIGPDVSVMVTPGDQRNANGVYATWYGTSGTCRISEFAANELLKTIEEVEAC